MMHMLRRLASEDSGQDIIEYALLGAGIAVLMIGVISAFQTQLATVYQNIGTRVGSIAP